MSPRSANAEGLRAIATAQAAPFGPDARFEHIGMAVRSIKSVVPEADIIEDPIQNVRVAFGNWHDCPLEYVEPVDETSPVFGVLKRGQTYYHLCFAVPDLEMAATHAAASGYVRLKPPAPAVAFGGRRIMWLFHSVFGLVELVETDVV